MLSKIWLTVISSVILYIIYLPLCESAILFRLLCQWLRSLCSDDLVAAAQDYSTSVCHYNSIDTTSSSFTAGLKSEVGLKLTRRTFFAIIF
uniref:Uncharacterized protein n=1 Tax=Trichobilharzia regenti TaxID=157069 RepID=A0AA85IX83_TRIRE|nr:unnamed protein product [Trichobilharzia regenti]